MGAPLRDVLRRLCAEAGWTYAVFWRVITGQNSTHLIWEDGHCKRMRGLSGFEAMDLLLKEQGLVRNACNDSLAELKCQTDDKVGTLVHKTMVHQVHVLGHGIIGQAAVTGDHQWILGERFNDHGLVSKGLAEMNHQFLAGIQTIAVIPVLPHGVVQLGSVQMVMEDIGFVNHVRYLFAHLGRVPGALLANVTRKDLSKKSQMLGMPISNCHSENFVTQIDERIPGLASGSNSQLGKSPVVQLSCSLMEHASEKMPPTASEVPLIKQTITSTEIPLSHRALPMTQPGSKPIYYLNNQLEGGNLGAQVLIPHSGVRSIQQTQPYGSGSEIKGQSSLVTSGLRFLEEQFLSISDIKSEVPNKFSEPKLNATKAVELRSDWLFPGSSQDLDIGPSLIGNVASIGNVNGIGTYSTLPGGTVETVKVPCPNLPMSGAPRLSNQTNHSDGCQVISADSCPGKPSSISSSSQSVLDTGKYEKKNDLVKALDHLSTKFDAHDSCHAPLSGFPQDCRFINDTSRLLQREDEEVSPFFLQPTSENDLFDVVGLDIRKDHFCGSSNNMFGQRDGTNTHELDTEVSTYINQLDVGPVVDSVDYDISCSGVFSAVDPDQLLDAVVSKVSPGVKHSPDVSVSCKTSFTKISSSVLHGCSPTYGGMASSQPKQGELLGLPPMLLKKETAGSTSVKTEDCSLKSGGYKSQISLWVESGQNVHCNGMSTLNIRRVDEMGKLNRKRARPGENPRPRPKDRQMIQDRVKELREIVPNGAKCSIDALLEKTIKHMLFLQSVTKHADKLKETGEPKIIIKDGGLVLKDNFEGGATWAFEVGTQSMICPIIVEDLNPPRQMLVEMLCEERGFFLEIADLIRGLGLTILKGVMEAQKDKVWARFAVEANRDVTRMEIFLSLVRLLEPTGGSSLKPQGIDSITLPHMFHQASIPATGSSDHLL